MGRGMKRRSSRSCTRQLGIAPSDVQFIDGDTDRVAFGMGSNGSRSMVTGGIGADRSPQTR